MSFVLIVAIVYLYLKYRDISKDLENINNHIESIENFVDTAEEKGENNEKISVE